MKTSYSYVYVLAMALSLVLAGAQRVSAQTTDTWAKDMLDKSQRHHEWVDVKAGDRTIKCFIAYPEAKENTPAVLVIHEIFGASNWIQLTCDELAAAGYIAIAPDLVSGKAPKGGGTSELTSSSDVQKIVTSTKPDEVKEDLNAVADYLKNKEKVPSYNGKLVSMGFCWGGGQSFNLATYRPDLKAALVFYGAPPPATEMSKVVCPVYGFYGGMDNRVTSTVPTAKTGMEAAKKTYDPVIYEGAGHGFMRSGEDPNDKSPTAEANKKARTEAWVRVKELLKKI